MSEHVEVKQAGGVLVLTLNRLDKKNALTDAMYGALADAMERAERDAGTRAILFLGRGDMFCAGNDLGDFLAAGSDVADRNVFRFIRCLGSATKPLVAGVQGRGVGIGTTMLLHCDHVVLAEGTLLSTPFVNLGLVPEAASSLLLPARIGHARAFAMLAMGETMTAEAALDTGLANAVVPAGDLAKAAHEAAARIAALPPRAVQATRALMHDREAITARIEAENREFIARLASPEAREAFTAFAEKRAPDFSRFF